MARHLFPARDVEYRRGALPRLIHGTTVQVWLDAAGTVPATGLVAADGTTPLTTVTVDGDSRRPALFGADGVQVMYEQVAGGPIEQVTSADYWAGSGGGGGAPSGPAGGSLGGTYPNPTIAAGAVGGPEVAASIKDPAAGTAGLRTLGTSATSAAAGNDARLSDARTPLGHAASHASAGPDPVTPAAIGADPAGAGTTAAAAAVAAIPSNGPAGTPSLRTLGTGATTATAGNDARLSDSRVPTAHAASHAAAGSDPVTPAAIGASAVGHTHAGAGVRTSGVVYVTTGTAGGNANPSTSGAWVQLTDLGEIAVPAVAGDLVEAVASFLTQGSSGSFHDIAIKVGASLVWFASTGTATPAVEGDPGLYFTLQPHGPAFATVQVQAGHLDGGSVHFVLAMKANGTGKTFYSTDYPFRWRAINHGPAL